MSEDKDWNDSSFEGEKMIEKAKTETPEEIQKMINDRTWVDGGYHNYGVDKHAPGLTIREPPPPPPPPQAPSPPIVEPETPPR